MQTIKNLLPTVFKLKIKQILRFMRDIFSRDYFYFAKKNNIQNIEYQSVAIVFQDLKTTPNPQNKIYNIGLASEKINNVLIKPNEIFSFWNIVGEPTKAAGFLEGRNLSNGKLATSYGGGLCQLSSIVYHVALLAKLEIMERYNHSVDIYDEKTRFTPLGSDATVAFAYKDLRFRNTSGTNIFFKIEIKEDKLYCNLFAEKAFSTREVFFQKEEKEKKCRVVTLDNDGKNIAISDYLLL